MRAHAQVDDDENLTTEQAAEFLKSKPRTMDRWRLSGTGPRYSKLGRRIVYRREALRAWVLSQERSNTRERNTRALRGRGDVEPQSDSA